MKGLLAVVSVGKAALQKYLQGLTLISMSWETLEYCIKVSLKNKLNMSSRQFYLGDFLRPLQGPGRRTSYWENTSPGEGWGRYLYGQRQIYI